MPLLSVTIPLQKCHSTEVIERDISCSSSSTSQFSPVHVKTPFEGELGSDSDVDSSASSLNLFEEGHANSPFPVAIEEEKDADQVLLIPHTSPFFNTPNTTSGGSDYSSPSVCPTLSGKFDVVHSARNTPSSATFAGQIGPVVDSKRDQMDLSGLLSRRRARINT